MAYSFGGFFAIADETVLRSALERWSVCGGRVISQPFMGIGVSCLDECANTDLVKAELPSFSKQFPSTTFVWIEVECFGGLCDHSGFVCHDGEILLPEDWIDDMDASKQVLARLLQYLGVESTVFAPFERGYFSNT